MKKLLMLISFLVVPSLCLADPFTDYITATLLEHVSPSTQIKSGSTDVALMSSVILIGKSKNSSIFDVQLGLSAPTNAEEGQPNGGSFIYGGFFKVSSLLKNRVKFPPEWVFLNSIEHGVTYNYDTRQKKDYIAYQIALPFDLAKTLK